MAATERPVETPTSKKTVAQAAIAIGFVLAAVVILLASFLGGGRKVDLGTAAALAPQTELSTATPDQFARAAQQLANLTPETRGLREPGGRGGDTLSASAGDPEALLRALTMLGPGASVAPPSPLPGPSIPSPEADQARREKLQLRLSPLAGAIQTPAKASVDPEMAAFVASGQALAAGSVLYATLDNAVSSDYPGAPWVATIARPARLKDGRIAIPAGSKVVGTTSQDDGPNQILQGRLVLSAQKIVRPDGSELTLAARALDAAGIGAISGPTDRHVVAQAGGVIAYALIGAASAGTTTSAPISTQSQLQTQAVQGAGQQVAPLANRYLSVQPTVVARSGSALRFVLKEALYVNGGQS